MCDVLDMDPNDAYLASADLDCEAMSCVLIFGQPVSTPICPNPPDFVLIAVACGPNYFRLEKALARYE